MRRSVFAVGYARRFGPDQNLEIGLELNQWRSGGGANDNAIMLELRWRSKAAAAEWRVSLRAPRLRPVRPSQGHCGALSLRYPRFPRKLRRSSARIIDIWLLLSLRVK